METTIVNLVAREFFIEDADLLRTFIHNQSHNLFDIEYAKGSKIQAIKEFRRATGFGLKDAKDAVEAIMAIPTYTQDALTSENSMLNLQVERQQEEINKLRSTINTLMDELDNEALRRVVTSLI